MSYATKILAVNGKMEGTGNGGRRKQFVDSVPCAYCRGTGRDPKYGQGVKCPVCKSDGKLSVKPPVVS